MKISYLFSLTETTIKTALDYFGYPSDYQYFVPNKHSRNIALYIPNFDAGVNQLDNYLRQIQPELVVPIAYWIGSELSQQEFEIEKRNDPFKSNLSGWVIVDPVQTPCEREIIVGELMHKAFSPLHLGRDQTFLSAGIHSLNILELRMLIQKKLKITVTYEQIHTLGTQRLISAWLRYAPSCCDSILEEYIYDGLEIPANKAQKAIFVAANTHSSQTAYNVPIVLEIERSFDASIIYNALLSLVERHLALRATFFIKGDDLFQRINSRVRLPFIIRNLPSNELEKAMYSFRQPFDILRGPLIRACLFETYENYRTLLLDFHHLIIDGISMQIFISEFCSLLQGKVLEPVDDYIKTIVEENVYTKSESTRVDNAYWNNLVEKPLKATRLTTAGLVGVNGGECIKVEIANSLINTIQSVVTTHETTLHVFFLSTLHVLLAKLLKEDSTVVGVPFSGRAMATNLNVVGMFAQTLPSRHTISNSHKFNELLDTVAAEHLQHMMFRGNNIWHWENLKDPGFSIVFTSHRFNFDLKGIGRWRAFYYPESHFDLLIYLVENDSKFELHFEYDCSKFDRNTIQYYADAFLNLAEQFASEPAKVINRASLFSPIQTVTWRNQTNPSIGYDQLTGSVIDRWNQSVQDWPLSIALEDGFSKLSYIEVDARANKAAKALISHGVKHGDHIALLSDRCVDYIIALLAILKSGAIYVPLDPAYPTERLAYMANAVGCKLCIVTEGRNIDFPIPLIAWDYLLEESNYSINLPSTLTVDDIAYIMFTSGSTGKPKGVKITHRNILRLATSRNIIPINQNTKVLLTGAPAFDATTFEIWVPLLNGGSIVVLEKHKLLDTILLRDAIEKYNSNLMWMTAPLFAQHVEVDPMLFGGVAYLIVGGDVVSPKAVRSVHIYTPEVTIINGYGPTENTTFSTFYVIPKGHYGVIPIGHPLIRSTAYVLDDGMNLLPPGAIGELYVGGEGVSAGYVDKDLDSEHFIIYHWPDGFEEKLYRTGDLARSDLDGTLRLLGRNDRQVKIRGYRVELGEVQNIVCTFDGIKNAHVIYHRNEIYDGLTVYVVADRKINCSHLFRYLQDNLPPHMIPIFFCQADEIELTVNGKVDENRLPLTLQPLGDQEGKTTPVNILSIAEEIVANIWRDLLCIEHVDIDTDFLNLGGNSLKLVTLSTRLEAYYGKRPSIKSLYVSRTVRLQAKEFIKNLDNLSVNALNQNIPAKKIRLQPTSAQSRLFLLDKVSEGKAPYLIPILLKLSGVIDKVQLKNAWQSLVKKHEFLRSQFIEENDLLWIEIGDFGCELCEQYVGPSEVQKTLSTLLSEFSLSNGQIASATLIQTPDENWLAFIFHHIAFDGEAVEILLKDFSSLYAGRELNNNSAKIEELWPVIVEQELRASSNCSYWIELLKNSSQTVQLPSDRQRKIQMNYKGQTIRALVGKELEAAVSDLAKELGLTPYMVWLTGAVVVLWKYTHQDDLTIGTVSAGRLSKACENFAGMFANTLPLRFNVSLNDTFTSLLERVKNSVFDGLEHQVFDLRKLIDTNSSQRENWRNPLFNVMFSMTTIEKLQQLDENLSWERVDWDYPTAKFDLSIFVIEEIGHCRIAVEFAEDVLSREMAESFMGHYLNALRILTAKPDISLATMSLLDQDEFHLLIDEFNQTNSPYSTDLLIHQLFESQASCTPDAIALIQDNYHMSYQELDYAANRVGHLLQSQGCTSGVPVMVMMDRTPAMIVAVLGVLKAGGYYVPVDLSHPAQRINTIAKTLNIKLLITDQHSLSRCDENLAYILTIDAMLCMDTLVYKPPSSFRYFDYNDITSQRNDKPNIKTKPVDLAYTIFTSGSTGIPKGVAVTHQPVVNLIEWVNKTYKVIHGDTLLFVTSLCFDLSVYDIFGVLGAGGTLHIASSDDLHDPLRLLQIIQNEKITFWNSAPAALQQMVQVVKNSTDPISQNLRLVFLSGDWVPTALPGIMKKLFPECNLTVLGGATEAAIWSNYYNVVDDCSEWVSIPYGRPIQNARYYVLDDSFNPCPIGIPGRLFIGGDCLAVGYAQQPELTAARFVNNPFDSSSNTKIYDTGDIARWRADGNLIFLGREDHQVKIRGYRVELGEIAHCLKGHPYVEQVLILAQPDASGTLALVAHIVRKDGNLTVTELSSYAATILPSYMVPQWFSFLDEFPVTSNGKFDRERLPNIQELMKRQEESVDEKTLDELAIHDVWCEILERKSVPLDLSFHAAGGNSLLIVRLFSIYEEKWPGVFTIPLLFTVSTIREQANLISLSEQTNKDKSLESDDLSLLLEQVSLQEIDINEAIQLLSTK